MNSFQNYAVDNMVKGWTRIDMLVALYDRTIATIGFAQQAKHDSDESRMALKLVEANRFILALHSGLDTEQNEIARDIARLLNFVMLRLEQQNFDEAIHFLTKIQNTFEQIREEATELEKSGKIPPLLSSSSLNTVA